MTKWQLAELDAISFVGGLDIDEVTVDARLIWPHTHDIFGIHAHIPPCDQTRSPLKYRNRLLSVRAAVSASVSLKWQLTGLDTGSRFTGMHGLSHTGCRAHVRDPIAVPPLESAGPPDSRLQDRSVSFHAAVAEAIVT